jgi:RNA polymerase sigma-70 factor, ECF subfamily
MMKFRLPTDPHAFAAPLEARALEAGNDVDLVTALQAGRPEAPAVAWHRYAPLVFGICSRALGSDVEAEDLTQDVFYRLFARIGTLRKPEALRSFVTSFAIRTVKWELRRRRARRYLTLSSTGELPDAPAGFVSADNRYALQRFYRALDRLTARERLVLVLRHVQEMTLEEVADHMEISLATVKRTLRRANARAAALVGGDAELHTMLGRRGQA